MCIRDRLRARHAGAAVIMRVQGDDRALPIFQVLAEVFDLVGITVGRAASVSYTHLDVYKRQGLGIDGAVASIEAVLAVAMQESTIGRDIALVYACLLYTSKPRVGSIDDDRILGVCKGDIDLIQRSPGDECRHVVNKRRIPHHG